MLFFICGLIGAVLFAATAHNALSAGLRAVGGFLVLGMIGYFVTPTLGFNFVFLPFWVLVIGIAGLALSGMGADRMSYGGLALTVIGAIWLIVVPIFSTWGAFHADEYRNMIGEVQESQFADDVSPVDINQVRTVSESLARRMGEKRLGEIPGLGSRVDLGQMNIQIVNGCFGAMDNNNRRQELCFNNELVWVAPLVHSGVFKQWSHGSTPGYIMVSASDVSRVIMVTALDNVRANTSDNPRMGTSETAATQQLEMRYFISGGYFGYNVERHLRGNGYLTSGITDYSFEIRDDGRPFWVVTTYEKNVGFSGADATGVVTVDVQTGAIEAYSIEEAPAWIDRIQPESFVQSQLDDWGDLVHGYWNWGNTDKLTTTPGMSLVFGADGQSYWYSGLQSVGADQGTVGFVLVNTRTKEARWYRVAGATETAAVGSAENARGVREAGYTGSSAILYNVANIPTYFTVLHGTDGLPKMYAFINVEDYNIVGVGRSPRDALRDYQINLSRSRSVDMDDLVDRETFEAVVTAITTEMSGDSVFYYMMLEGKDGKEYYAGQSVSVELKWTRVGDTVQLVVDDGESRSVNIIRFDNTRVGLTRTN